MLSHILLDVPNKTFNKLSTLHDRRKAAVCERLLLSHVSFWSDIKRCEIKSVFASCIRLATVSYVINKHVLITRLLKTKAKHFSPDSLSRHWRRCLGELERWRNRSWSLGTRGRLESHDLRLQGSLRSLARPFSSRQEPERSPVMIMKLNFTFTIESCNHTNLNSNLESLRESNQREKRQNLQRHLVGVFDPKLMVT